jgi:hypothetical protein
LLEELLQNWLREPHYLLCKLFYYQENTRQPGYLSSFELPEATEDNTDQQLASVGILRTRADLDVAFRFSLATRNA